MQDVRISVRNLVEFIMRSGDIDNRHTVKASEQAMQEGFSTAPDNIRSMGFGAGMGLPNMKRYTDEMDIKSEPGKGTAITMTVYV